MVLGLLFFFITVIILHRLVSLFSLCPLCSSRCVSSYLAELADEKRPSGLFSCSVECNRRDTAESCLSSPALVCSHFISLDLLSGRGADQRRCGEKTHTQVRHTLVCFALLCSACRVEPIREPFSAYASCHVHILDFCFELS